MGDLGDTKSSEEYLLTKLGGKAICGFMTELVMLEPDLTANQLSFELYLRHIGGQRSLEPVLKGLFSTGTKHVSQMELEYCPEVALEGTALENQVISISGRVQESALFGILGEAIPPGGTIVVEYRSKMQNQATAKVDLDARAILNALLHEMGFVSIKRTGVHGERSKSVARLQAEKPQGRRKIDD